MIDRTVLFGAPEDATETRTFRVFPKSGPDRWMLETRFRKPWHLKTWPRANFRARIINRVAWTMGALGLHLPARIEPVPVAPGSPYARLAAEYERLGIFLGTPGPNRKIVVFAERPDRSVFVKIPLGPASAELVRNETAALTELARDPDLAPLIPAHDLIAGHLAVENVETGGTGYGELALSEVARICGLLERRSRVTRPLDALRRDWEAAPPGDIAEHDAETRALIDTARGAARHFLDALPQDRPVACYMAHGDFTRWNVLRAADGTARVIDWELFGARPLHFDLVHYFASHDLLAASRTPAEVLARLGEIGCDLDTTVPWRVHVGLYFAVQALYYASVYERQAQLTQYRQARWQLEAWAEILQRLDDHDETADKELRATSGD